MSKNILRKIPAILIMLGITMLSTLPGNDPFLNTFQFSDKIKHFIAYFVLGLALCIWISRKSWLAKPLFWGILIVVLGTLFGMLDEFHQSFVTGRSCESLLCSYKGKLHISVNHLGDLTADFIGSLFSALAYFLAVKMIPSRPSQHHP
jgi:hypothetical protein